MNQNQNRWSLIEVEVSFIPGLPQIHFLGQADGGLKESAFRLKSAFRNCGYEFPKTKSIVVNLTPHHIKKVSPGIELAVALAILKLTDQGPEWNPSDFVIFGEIGLNGDIRFPDLGKPFRLPDNQELISGPGFETYTAGFCLSNLKDLMNLKKREKSNGPNLTPPPFLTTHLSSRQAEVIEILAVGELHTLISGSQGSGKSLVLDVLPAFLRSPSEPIFDFHKSHFSKTLSWRPVARPHHTISPQSMVGGGVPPKPGEITRAHGGALLLDELMEFKPLALEALREALSHQEITVSRGLQNETFLADFLLVGTTNLCPCGKWVPQKIKNCGYNERRCLSTLQKISGPLLDRLQGFFFFQEKMEKWEVPTQVLGERIKRSQNFQLSQGRSHNRSFDESDLGPQELKLWIERTNTLQISSARRRQACVAWARTLADLDLSEQILRHHFEKAFHFSIQNYWNLLKWGGGSG